MAEIVAVGPGGVVDGNKVEMYLNVGDKVLLSQVCRETDDKLDGQDYTILRRPMSGCCGVILCSSAIHFI